MTPEQRQEFIGFLKVDKEISPNIPENRYNIRRVQDLLGHKDVSTTMSYTHVLNRGGSGVHSPADRLGFGPESGLTRVVYADNPCSVCPIWVVKKFLVNC